jgi:diguanylate cyclase (GGDEF)-like protein
MGLLGRFSLLSLVATVVLGAVLGATLRSQIQHRAIENAGESARLIARFGIQPQLVKTDFTDGLNRQEIAALDQILRAGYTTGSVKTIKIWNAAGTVIYSNRHELIGERDGKDAGFRTALEGNVDSDVARSEQDLSRAPDDGRLLESYVPLSLASNGHVDGVFELYTDYGPVAASIRYDERRVFLVLGLGLLALYATLFRIVAGASRRLRRQAAESRHQARHDSLTTLANRGWMYEQISAVLEDSPGAAVMMMDVDRFKAVNDALGHHNGDLLLQVAAERLRGAVRDEDTVARLGGDEFAVLLPQASREAAEAVARRAYDAFQQPFRLNSVDVDVRVSVGVALFPVDSTSVDGLLRCADLAMYVAKDSGDGPVFYDSSHEYEAHERQARLASGPAQRSG